MIGKLRHICAPNSWGGPSLANFKVRSTYISILGLLCSLCFVYCQAEAAPSLIVHGDGRVKVVALTFDDGPYPIYTERLLAVLDAYNVKATFFVVGINAASHPQLVQEMAKGGHLIGNHSHHHPNMSNLSEDDIRWEWQMCSHTIRAIIGKMPRFCRPPGGRYNSTVISAARKEGLSVVLWTANGADYTGISSKAIEKRVLSAVRPGGIILLHEGVENTIEALPTIIETLRSKGYRFVTLNELIASF